MNQPIRGVNTKSGALWLSIIASLLLGASGFTLLRVRSVIEDFTESRIKGEVEQVVEKFSIIDSLLSKWLLRALDRLKAESMSHGQPSLDVNQRELISGVMGDRLVPVLRFGDFKVSSHAKTLINLPKGSNTSLTVFVRDGNQMVRLITSIETKEGASAVATLLDPEGPVLPKLLDGKVYKGLARILGELYYTKYIPIFDQSNEVIGAWYAGYQLAAIGDSIRKSVLNAEISEKTHLIVIDDDDRILYSSEDSPKPLLIEASSLASDLPMDQPSVVQSYVFEDYRYQFIPFQPWGMQVVSARSLSSVNQLALQLSFGTIALQLCAATSVVFLTWFYNRRLSKALKQGEEARLQAEEANHAKSSFLANMSHELRTPMNAIIGYSEILTEDCEDMEPDEIRDDLNKILSSAKHLLGLINSVLDLSKVEAGKMTVYAEDISLSDLINEVLASVKPLISKNNNELSLELNHSEEDLVNVDVTKLKQIILNLTSNACKFTEFGIVKIASSLLQDESGERLQISVSDSGIGMTDEQLGRLFQDFSQADESTTRKYGGTGLGLALSKRFSQMMLGDIIVTSEVNVGSQFVIDLPRYYSDQKSRSSEVSSRLPSEIPKVATENQSNQDYPTVASLGKVLIIDDDAPTRDVIERHLRSDGYAVMTARNGSEGLQSARTWKPDLIALDINMPGKNGWQVLDEIKKDKELTSIPVVLISKDVEGVNLKSVYEKAYCLAKPIDWVLLDGILSQFGNKSCHDQPYFLLIADQVELLDKLNNVFDNYAYRVEIVSDELAALSLIAKVRPALIIVDMSTKDFNGVAFIESLHRNPSAVHLPIVMMNTQDLPDSDQRRLQSRFTGVISSDMLNMSVLSERIASFLPPKEA
jgi:signal transduction histidine kinase/CheY-like chemotaxis protein